MTDFQEHPRTRRHQTNGPAASRNRRFVPAALVAAITLFLAACGSAGTAGTAGTGNGSNTGAAGGADTLQVLASFYPLQFVAQQVAGDLATVSNLTPPAADPHELELSIAAARAVGQADLVVTLGGFQPAVDAAIATQHPARVVDAADIVTLLPAASGGSSEDGDDDPDHEGEDHDHEGDDHDHEGDDHNDSDHDHGDGGHNHSIGGYDPHFWLDPLRLAQIAGPIADALSEADPANAATFHANADQLVQRLNELDQRFTTELAPFRGAKMVTSHAAFGYLAARYGLEQVGVTGIDHEIEPSPARLREIRAIVAENGVSTIFYETLSNPGIVQTLANDIGINAAEINTVEGLTNAELAAGEDYFTVMNRNLDTLVANLNAPSQ
ncbi:MAG: metal ABC transporter substrate-binding protein [Cellulomonadaceae bacterium]|nr:metal ABC transporter substrate-binding protein [Cellulomonadaceae bacterium]